MKIRLITSITLLIIITACSSTKEENQEISKTNKHGQLIYQDKPFIQDYTIKYYLPKGNEDVELHKIAADRNENIQIVSSEGLLYPYNGHFLTNGELIPEKTYKYMINKKIFGILSYQNQFVYTDEEGVFSNAWAGTIYNKHSLVKPNIFCGGNNFDF